MDKANEHESRSREIADTLRKFLIGIHTGGIGALLAIANFLYVPRKWIVWSALPFVSGLVVVGGSLLLAKHRELKRRDAAQQGEKEPDYSGFWCRSYTWDSFSFVLFIVGGALLIYLLFRE